MFSMLTNLTKAVAAVAATPVAFAVDVVKLPVTAFEDTDPFKHTQKKIDQASEAFDRSVGKE